MGFSYQYKTGPCFVCGKLVAWRFFKRIAGGGGSWLFWCFDHKERNYEV